MRARGLARRPVGRRGVIIAGTVSVATLAVAGCGSSTFPNEPRAAAPIEVTASLGPRAGKVSPAQFGAGRVNFTVANLSSNPASLQLSGPISADGGQSEPKAVPTSTKNLNTGSPRR